MRIDHRYQTNFKMKTFQFVTVVSLIFNLVFCHPTRNNSQQQEHGTTIPPTQGSDRGLYNFGLYQGDIVLSPTRSELRNAVLDKRLLWPYGAVVYSLDPSVGCPDSWRCKMLGEAMEQLHSEGCVRFKQWSGETYRIHIFINEESGACWSPVGRTGEEKQLLSLGSNCWHRGIVLHELLHAVGFWHEMTRPDRDSHINVYWNNIMSGFSSAFYKQTDHEVNTLGEKFDYRSVMMYDEYAFSKDGVSETLSARSPGVVIGPIWKKYDLSASDTRRLHRLYSCKGTTNLAGFPYDVSCDFNENSCGYKNSGISSWNWRRISEKEGYLYTTKNRSLRGFIHSSTMHPIKSFNNTSQYGCVSFHYFFDDNTDSYLRLLHAYVKTPTENNFNPQTAYELWSSDQISGSWRHVQIPLYVTQPFKLLFESSFSRSSKNGTIAIDNIKLSYSPCDVELATKIIAKSVQDIDYKKIVSDDPLN